MEKNCLNQKNVIEFARKAFKIDQETHEAIYQAVIEKEVSAYRFYSHYCNISICISNVIYIYSIPYNQYYIVINY